MQTIKPPASLVGSRLHTYEKIFQHPAAHDLPWRDVLSLFCHLGDVIVELNGYLKLTRHGHSLVLPSPRTKELTDADELMKLRHFLEASEAVPPATAPAGTHLLLVIDHNLARLFRTQMHGAVPLLLVPHEPADFFRHAHESREFFSGKKRPAPNNFFKSVVKELQAADKILIMGTATGGSSEMEQFTTWLKTHHPDVARRITGTLTVDEHHLTEPQLLAKAREFYEQAPAS